MAKKGRYNYASPAAAGIGLAVAGAALTNPATAPFAASIGTLTAGFAAGVDLSDGDTTIKEKFNDAMNKTWQQIYVDYQLTDDCLTELKQEVIGENTSTDEFVDNLKRKKLDESYATIIQTKLEKHREGLKQNSENTWDNDFTKNASKDIASRLISTLQTVFNKDDLLKILKAIADRSNDIKGDIVAGRAADKLEHEQLMQMLKEISVSINASSTLTSTDFTDYYKYVEKRFTRKSQKIMRSSSGSILTKKLILMLI